MPWKPNQETVPGEFLEPVPKVSRIGDFAFLLLGIACMAFALQEGGAALIILPFGIASTAAGIWLLLHRNRMLLPPTIAVRIDSELKSRLGQQACTPKTRTAFMSAYLTAVSKLHAMTRDLWLAGFSVGRGSQDTYASSAHFRATGSDVAVLVTPTTEERFTVCVSGLTDTQRDGVAAALGVHATSEPDVTRMPGDSAEAALDSQETGDPQVEVFHTGSADATATAIEHLFTRVVRLQSDYALTARLACKLGRTHDRD